MENPIRVCTIDGISYPLLGGGFMDISLPHQPCSICKYAICSRCGDLFNLKHECKRKWEYVRSDCICELCDKKYSKKESIEIFKIKNSLVFLT